MEKIKNIPSLRFPEFEENWRVKKLGDVMNFKVTNSFSRENLNYENGNVKNIHYGDIHTKFQTLFDITRESVPFINEEVSIGRISDDFYCKEGDIIFADASEDLNDVGKSIEIINLNNEKLLSGLHTLLARPIENTFEIGFNGYLFKSNTVRLQIQKESQGSKVLSINVGRVSGIEISFPTLPEQQKIASFLTAVDNKLQALKQKKTLLDQYKKGVMQKIFSQELRFAADDGNDYPDWEERKVKDIFILTRGSVLSMTLVSEKQDNENYYPVYSSQTKKNGLSGYYNKFLFEDCITWTTDGAGAGDVNFRKGKFYCTNVCGVLKSDKGYANVFIAEILNSISRKYVSYVGNPKLMNNVMAEISISIPLSIEEQTKIANFLSAIDDEINHCQEQIVNTEVWKKGLLQQMFV
jgi:type I restriction enzyme S subunit